MPLYEYVCPQCSERTEILCQSYDAPENLTCRQCGCSSLRRVMSHVNHNSLNSGSPRNLSVIDRDVKRRFEKKVQNGSLLG